jgi:hypothetical protein
MSLSVARHGACALPALTLSSLAARVRNRALAAAPRRAHRPRASFATVAKAEMESYDYDIFTIGGLFMGLTASGAQGEGVQGTGRGV